MFSLAQQRRTGNEYVPAHNRLATEILRCNNNVRVLTLGGGANAVYYALQYTTKADESTPDVRTLMIAAAERSEAREARFMADLHRVPTWEELQSLGRRRVASFLHSITSKNEISAQMAVLYLLHGSFKYTSHNLTPVPVSQLCAFVTGGQDRWEARQQWQPDYDPVLCETVHQTPSEDGESVCIRVRNICGKQTERWR